MNNYTLAEINKSIPYIPVLRQYVGSMAACILMQQLDYWFSTKNGAPFYKFLAAQNGEKSHPAYKPGDSWCEELSISPDEFRTSFDRIGYRYKSLTEYRRAEITGNPFQGLFYASYHDKIKGITWYVRNHELVDALLFEIFIRKSGNPIYGNRLSQSTYTGIAHSPRWGKAIPNNTEITTEITAEKTTTEFNTPVVVSPVMLENQSLSEFLSLIPAAEHSSRLCKAITAKLSSHGSEYTKSNIDCCLRKHSPNDGRNSLGGMIVLALQDDFAKATREKAADKASAKALVDEERRILDEQEKHRIEAKTKDALQWCESEEGRAFSKRFLSDDP